MRVKKPRLQQKFEDEVVKKIAHELNIGNTLSIPKIQKVVINMGVGNLSKNKDVLDQAKSDLAQITGQVPAVCPAKISVASFNVRKGMPVGLKVTLRKRRMYEFLDKLISVVMPRFRDFRGVSLSSFDKQGNYTIGIEDHLVFPEIDAVKTSSKSFEVTIVINSKNPDQSKRLLELLGFPFEKKA